jgi:hypothetical protein
LRIVGARVTPVGDAQPEAVRPACEDDAIRAQPRVNHAVAVCVREELGDVAHALEDLARIHVPLREQRCDRRSLDQLAREPRAAIGQQRRFEQARHARVIHRLEVVRLA